MSDPVSLGMRKERSYLLGFGFLTVFMDANTIDATAPPSWSHPGLTDPNRGPIEELTGVRSEETGSLHERTLP
jgi:hypothetical protein